jgi:hypothetical protein
MSLNNNFPSVNETSSLKDDVVLSSTSPDALSYSNDNNGWANFTTLENNANRNSEVNYSFDSILK